MTDHPVLGAVAYDPKVVNIWDGFRRWFRERDAPFDYVLFSNYERQVESLVAGHIDMAWNSPLAWIRTRRLAPSARPLAMRDSDRDLTSVIVVRSDSPVETASQLVGVAVGVGAVDSPQATLIPLAYLGDLAIDVRRFDVGLGLHGDHVGGERQAAQALMRGEIEAACMLDSNHLLFVQEGILPSGSTRIVAQTPPYDHCNMTVILSSDSIERFANLLLEMDYAEPTVRPLFDLEGLSRWMPGRTTGYDQLERAVEKSGFYTDRGAVVGSYHL